MERFIEAHRKMYAQALSEIKGGMKTSHWMWFIFPQMRGLGYSDTAYYYGIKDKAQAIQYMQDPTLKAHMLEICEALLELHTNDAESVFGHIDAVKLKSSMTLFAEASPEYDVFIRVLNKFFGEATDPKTIELLSRE